MVSHGSEPRGLSTEGAPFSFPQGRFGRMFPLFEFVDFDREMLGRLAQTMKAGQTNPDNVLISAGYTFLGQFIDHDITFDPTSSLEQQNDPDATQNFRTPLLELDNLYGSGPIHNSYLYQKADKDKFVIGEANNQVGEDLPRNPEGTAIIGDPRNDENLIVSQLHMVFLKFHNAVVDKLKEIRPAEDMSSVFEEAQRIVRWHYQWIIVHEFLPRILGREVANDIFSPDGEIGFKLFFNQTNQFGERFIPVEFAVAGYRFGHSQIRPGYSINTPFPGVPLFPAAPPQNGENILSLHIPDISNRSGGKQLNEDWNIAWGRFFEMNNANAAPHVRVRQTGGFPQLSKQIDTLLSEPLFRLAAFRPRQDPVAGPVSDDRSPELPLRNLVRGKVFRLPYGQWVARKLGSKVKVLTLATPGVDPSGALAAAGLPADQWPLWFYILKEAEVLEKGQHLGPVGGHIVGETFAALLVGDNNSYIAKSISWTPMTNQPFIIPTKSPKRFTIADLIRFALGPTDRRTTNEGGHAGP